MVIILPLALNLTNTSLVSFTGTNCSGMSPYTLIHNIQNLAPYRPSAIEDASLTFQQRFDCFAILFPWQNFPGRQASIVIPPCSRRLRLSHPPPLHRIQTLTPEEHLGGEGSSQNYCWTLVLPVDLSDK